MLHSYLEVDRKYIANLQKNWYSPWSSKKIYNLLSLLVPAKYLSLLSTSLQGLQKENKKGERGDGGKEREERKRGRQGKCRKRPKDLF